MGGIFCTRKKEIDEPIHIEDERIQIEDEQIQIGEINEPIHIEDEQIQIEDEQIQNEEVNEPIHIEDEQIQNEEINEPIHIEEINETTHINEVNEYCLIEIFLRLPIEKMFEMEEVCFWWQFVMDRTWPRIRSLTFDQDYRLSDGSTVSCEFIEKVLWQCGAYLKNLRLELIDSSSMLKCICNYCNNLTTIYLQFQSDEDCHDEDARAFSRLENIKSFTLKNADERCSTEFLLFLPRTVESIHLFPIVTRRRSIRNDIFGRFDALDCLEMDSFTVSPDMMVSLSKKRTITKLTLSHCNIDYGMNRISKLRNLEYLHLNDAFDDILWLLAGRCKKLKYLKLVDAEYVSDQGIEGLRHLRKLEELYLSGMEGYVTDFSIGRLRGIKKLHCRDCKGVKDDGIMRLIRKCPGLQELNLEGTSITGKTLRFAIKETRNRENSVILKLIADLNNFVFDVENEGHSPFLVIEQS